MCVCVWREKREVVVVSGGEVVFIGRDSGGDREGGACGLRDQKMMIARHNETRKMMRVCVCFLRV